MSTKLKPLAEMPEYIAARKELDRLEAEEASVNAQLDSVPSSRAFVAREADKLLAGGTLDEVSGVDVAKLQQLDAVIKTAIAKQEQNIADLHRKLSREAVALAMPQYRTAVKSVAVALVELARKVETLSDIRDETAALGYATGGFPQIDLPRTRLDKADDHAGNVCEFLRDLVEFNLLDVKDPIVKETGAIAGREMFLPGERERRAKAEAAETIRLAEAQRLRGSHADREAEYANARR